MNVMEGKKKKEDNGEDTSGKLLCRNGNEQAARVPVTKLPAPPWPCFSKFFYCVSPFSARMHRPQKKRKKKKEIVVRVTSFQSLEPVGRL